MIDGPELTEQTSKLQEIFPERGENEVAGLITIKVDGDVEAAIEELKALVQGFGIDIEAFAEFATIEFVAGDGEILIGLMPATQEAIGFLTPFIMDPTILQGDGSEELFFSGSINLAATFDDFLEDEPLFTNFLKGFSLKAQGQLYSESRETVFKLLGDDFKKYAKAIPFLAPLLMLKKVEGLLELECTDEMKDQIKELVEEEAPQAAMSFKDILEMAKMSGAVPMEMLEPVLTFIQTYSVNHFEVLGAKKAAGRVIVNLPGLENVAAHLLEE